MFRIIVASNKEAMQKTYDFIKQSCHSPHLHIRCSQITVLTAAFAIALAGCERSDGPHPQADGNIIVYGKIYTAKVDTTKAAGPFGSGQYIMADAMVIKGDRYVYVGTREGADSLKNADSRIIDRSNAGIIIPGMTDGHAHYLLCYLNRQMSDNTIHFTTDQSYQSVLDQVRQFIEDAGKKGKRLDYVYGEGYNWGNWLDDDEDVRNRKDLDAISTEIPIFLAGFDQHSALVNTRAMINAGIVDENDNIIRENIAGGFAQKESDNPSRLSGVFSERATSLLMTEGLNYKMRPTEAQATKAAEAVQDYLLSVGITNIIEGWSTYYGSDDETMYKMLTSLELQDKLHFNASLAYEIEPWYNDNNPFCHIDTAIAFRDKYKGYKHIHPDYIKLFMDGCVETGTGFLTGKYADGPDGIFSGHGTALWSLEDTRKIVEKANANNLSVHTHAMGDGAVHRCVEAYSAVGKKELRNSICHLRNVDPNDYAAIKQHDIACAVNMNWHSQTAYGFLFGLFLLPEPYCYESYPIRSFFNNGILMSQCTDTPAHDGVNYPMWCMQVAVTGCNDETSYAWWTEEIANRYQALQALTYNGAWQLHLEKERGSIEVGKYADFVILDNDVLTCDAQMLRFTRVLKTFFEGQEVYSR